MTKEQSLKVARLAKLGYCVAMVCGETVWMSGPTGIVTLASIKE